MLRFHVAGKSGRAHLDLDAGPMVFGRDPEPGRGARATRSTIRTPHAITFGWKSDRDRGCC